MIVSCFVARLPDTMLCNLFNFFLSNIGVTFKKHKTYIYMKIMKFKKSPSDRFCVILRVPTCRRQNSIYEVTSSLSLFSLLWPQM